MVRNVSDEVPAVWTGRLRSAGGADVQDVTTQDAAQRDLGEIAGHTAPPADLYDTSHL